MKIKIIKKLEMEVLLQTIVIEFRAAIDGVPSNLINDDVTRLVIDIDSGVVKDWEKDEAVIVNGGTLYAFIAVLGANGEILSEEKGMHGYIPRPIPMSKQGEVELFIDHKGKIVNWPDNIKEKDIGFDFRHLS